MNCWVNPTTQFNLVRKYLTLNEWAFWKSTESALFSYIFAATISGERVVLVLLELTAAFNTVNEKNLDFLHGGVGSALGAEHRSGTIQRWTFYVSIGDSALMWSPTGFGSWPFFLLSLSPHSRSLAFIFIAMLATFKSMSCLKRTTRH